MASRDELDLLARVRPTILERGPLIMDEAETEAVLHHILESDPASSRAPSGPPIRRNRGGRRLAVGIAAVLALTLVALASIPLLSRSTTSGHGLDASSHPLRWQLVSEVTGPWHSLTTIAPRSAYQVHCASATTCYAVDSNLDGLNRGELAVTTDGGHSWRTVHLPVPFGWNSAMACVDANTCAIVGMESTGTTLFLETHDDGRTWSREPAPAQLDATSDHARSVPAIAGMACTSATHCVAVASTSGSVGSSDAFTTADGGVSWSESKVPVTVDDSSGLNTSSLQCRSNGNCIVAGFTPGSSGEALAAAYSTDGGTSWQAASVPTHTYGVASISCPEASDCLMVSFGGGVGQSTVLHSTNGGRSWNRVATHGLPRALLTGISCSDSASCWTSGGTTEATFPRGISKSLLALSTDEGQRWQQASLPSGISAVEGVSCPTGTACYALAMRQMKPGHITLVLLSNTSS